MEINEAIKRTRAVAQCKRRCAATLRAHPFISRERAGRTEEIEAEALETVCDALEAERRRSKTVYVYDVLGESAGDGRNGTEQGKHIADAQNAREGQKNAN